MENMAYPEHPGFKAQETAANAAVKMQRQGRAEVLRSRVLGLLQEVYPGGLTPDEAAEKLGEHYLDVRPRFSELAAVTVSQPVPLIEPTGEKRPSVRGNPAHVLRLTAGEWAQRRYGTWADGKQAQLSLEEVTR